MKTCPNPNCKFTGIPDDAQFCPKCGEPLVTVSNPWAYKHEALQKKRSELLENKHQLSVFARERVDLFAKLSKDANFTKAMQECATVIQKNKERQIIIEKKRRLYRIALVLLLISLLVWGAMLSTDGPGDIREAFRIIGGIGLSASIWAGVILILLLMRKTSSPSVDNDQIKTFLSPFIHANVSNYLLVLGLQNSTTSSPTEKNITFVLEHEICDQEGVSKSISAKIEEIESRIQEIEKQIETLKTL